jgi:ribonuclease J
MTSLTFFGGVGEIGGNSILIEDGVTRILLDFGRRMGEASRFYEEFIQIRSKCALLDLLKLKILPMIDGIYSESYLNCLILGRDEIDVSTLPLDKAKDYWQTDLLAPYDRKRPGADGVFISHAHLDHIQDLSFIHKDIPVYCTQTTKVLAKAITDVSNGGVDYQFYHVKDKIWMDIKSESHRTAFPGELTFKEKSEKKIVECQKSGFAFTRDIKVDERKFVVSETGKIKSLTYKIIPVGHSVPGASSLLLITGEGKRILYTGDIRFHGKNEPTMEEYIENLADGSIDLMICEGTRIDSDTELTEEDVFKDIKERIENAKGLVLIDFGWKDITRFDTIAKAAEETERIFVINPKLAYLLYELHNMNNLRYGEPAKMEHVKVYKKRQGDYLYSKHDYDKFKAGYLEHWGRNYAKDDQNIVRIAEKIKSNERLTLEEQTAWELATHHIEYGVPAYKIRENPGKYILMFSFWDANELIDLSTTKGNLPNSTYIRASCEPFSDEMEIDEQKLMNWLDKFGVSYETEVKNGKVFFKRAHVSGHASRPELKKLIIRIKPKKLIPIHTLKPQEFSKMFKGSEIEVVLPEPGKTYSL